MQERTAPDGSIFLEGKAAGVRAGMPPWRTFSATGDAPVMAAGEFTQSQASPRRTSSAVSLPPTKHWATSRFPSGGGRRRPCPRRPLDRGAACGLVDAFGAFALLVTDL
jgi:hypothetical protein